MKAILVNNGKMTWEEVPIPNFKNSEVLIKVKATAINRADLAQKAGLYPPPPGASEILGLECSGIIEKVGKNVKKRRVGEEVTALLAGGGYAEYVSCPEEQVLPIPKNLRLIESAAIPEAFATCWLNLFMEGKLKKNEKVLFHAGASGIGTAGIQLCKEFGCHSYITAGNKEKIDFCIKLGSKKGIVRSKNSYASFENYCPDGFDIILDPVGGNYFEENINNLAVDGRLIIIGILGGIKGKLNIGHLLIKRHKIIGSTIRSRSTKIKGAVMKELFKKVWPLFERKKIKPIIYKSMKITDVEKAHKIMSINDNIGKIVLEIC
tara:strand:+ start:2245 stop:3207 length:963 start_codon:yes stop_codon:yes gene_type:complete